MRTTWRGVGAAVLLATGTLLFAPAGATAAVGDAACQAAQELLEAARPQQARALMADLVDETQDPCVARLRDEAAAQIKAADALVSGAEALVKTDPAAARTKLDDAEGKDAQNARIAGVKAQLAKPTVAERTGTAWEGYLKAYLQPLQAPALAALVVILALLTAARVCALAPLSWPRSSRKGRRRAWVVGSVIAIASALSLTLLSARLDRSAWPFGATVIGLFLGVAAVVLWAFAIGQRLRISIAVNDGEGKVDEPATGRVIALLCELGAAGPRGLEVARGADVTALEGTPISGTPAGKVVQAVVQIWKTFAGVTPWEVRVDAESADRHAVTIWRNGHTVATAVIDRDALDLRTPRTPADSVAGDETGDEGGKGDLPDLYRMSAALVLVELSKAYDGFEALFDVSDWRSLGLYDVASNHYSREDSSVAKRLYAQSLRLDSNNLPAALALRHAEDRESTDPDRLAAYLEYLEQVHDRLSGQRKDALRARVLHTRLVLGCNLLALGRNTSYRTLHAGAELMTLLDDMARNDPATAALARSMRGSAASAFLSLADRAVEDIRFEDTPDSGTGTGTRRWIRWKDQPQADHYLVRRWERTNQGHGWARYRCAKPHLLITRPLPLEFLTVTPVPRRPDYGRVESAVAVHGAWPWQPEPGTVPPRVPPFLNFPTRVLEARTSIRDTAALDPRGHFNYACYHHDDYRTAVRHLRLARVDPALAEWMERDPWLARLRESREYREEFRPAPRKDVLAVEPLATHQKALRAAGITQVRTLARTSPSALAATLGCPTAQAQRLVGLAQLCDAVPRAAGFLTAELMERLVKRDVDSFARLVSDPDRPALAKAVVDDILAACVWDANEHLGAADALRTWLTTATRGASG